MHFVSAESSARAKMEPIPIFLLRAETGKRKHRTQIYSNAKREFFIWLLDKLSAIRVINAIIRKRTDRHTLHTKPYENAENDYLISQLAIFREISVERSRPVFEVFTCCQIAKTFIPTHIRYLRTHTHIHTYICSESKIFHFVWNFVRNNVNVIYCFLFFCSCQQKTFFVCNVYLIFVLLFI